MHRDTRLPFRSAVVFCFVLTTLTGCSQSYNLSSPSSEELASTQSVESSGYKIAQVTVSTDLNELSEEEQKMIATERLASEMQDELVRSLGRKYSLYNREGDLELDVTVNRYKLRNGNELTSRGLWSDKNEMGGLVKLSLNGETVSEFPFSVRNHGALIDSSVVRNAQDLHSQSSRKIAARVAAARVPYLGNTDTRRAAFNQLQNEQNQPAGNNPTGNSIYAERAESTNCSVDQILKMTKIGLSDDQIKAACN